MQVAYRLRVHFAGTTVPDDGSVDWIIDRELVTPPAGMDAQVLRLLDGRVEYVPYTVLLTDAAGAITARLFSEGRPTAIGRMVEVQRREVPHGTWETKDLRFISRIISDSPQLYELELSVNVAPYDTQLWAKSADIQIMPLGLTRAWHLCAAAGYTDPSSSIVPGRVIDVDGPYVRVQLQPNPVSAELREVVRDDIVAAPMLSTDGNFTALRLEVEGDGDFRVVSFGELNASTIDGVLGEWPGDPPTLPEQAWIAWPGHSFGPYDELGAIRLYFPDGVPTSEATPRLLGPAIDRITGEVIGIYTLATLAREVLDGSHGGDPIQYDPAAVSALAGLADEGVWLVVTSPTDRGTFLRQAVWSPYLVGPFVDGGILAPRAVWPGDSVPTDTLFRFDASTAVTSLRYEYGSSAAIRSIWRVDYQSAERGTSPVEASPFGDLVISKRSRERTLPDRPKVAQVVDQSQAVFRRVWADAFADLYGDRLFAMAGDGVQEYTLDGHPTNDAPLAGQLVLLDMAELKGPNAALGERSGTRVAIVTERSRMYSGGSTSIRYRLWDAGRRAHASDHADTAHADTHSDSVPHADYHLDSHKDVHSDVAHDDVHSDSTGHVDNHQDAASHQDSHGDAHNDLHSDDAHGDAHTDATHLDTHQDSSHGDSHGDAIHRRNSEFDTHCDATIEAGPICFHDDVHNDHFTHVDAHSDTAHDDTHADGTHADLHADSHQDAHADDAGHTDAHADSSSGGAHSDSHSDGPHADAHTDETHQDTHNDGAHADAHGDGAHTDWHDDADHADAHGDSVHTDAHDDAGHADAHSDTHTDNHVDVHNDFHLDSAHSDAHGDAAGPPTHGDAHTDDDHFDAHSDTHSDTAHSDSHLDSGHTDSHSDSGHADSHEDVTGFRENESDPHCDSGLETGIECHDDAHSDTEHTDVHNDVEHSDVAHGDAEHSDSHTDTHEDSAHVDSHTDEAAHVDNHSDTEHSDAAHVDSHFDSHSDVAHVDTHGDAAHGDSHGDTGHTDGHNDGEHGDGHRDQEHADAHADVVNSEFAHGDAHGDSSHTDTHSDTAHTDAHSDASGGPHDDSHTDTHNDDSSGLHDDSHGDSHTDSGGHSDSHSDVAHADSHTDQEHADQHTDWTP